MEKNTRTFMPEGELILFDKTEANKMISARELVLSLCKSEYDNWSELDKSKKQARMYRKCKEIDIDWNCIFIHEYISKGLVK